MSGGRRLRVRAPAKINLDLRILGRRPDGFHELRTLLQSIALHDELTLHERPGPLRVRCRRPGIPQDTDNLVGRAVALLWAETGRAGEPSGLSISLRKQVPAAAGLGGGSSDAAATLRALCRLWAIPLRSPRVRRVAAQLGSDVPFLVRGGLARGSGRGERLTRLVDLPRLWTVLATPGFGVGTADAYAWAAADARPASGVLPRHWRRAPDTWRNDLQPAVERRHPDIALMVDGLRQAGAVRAAMTGSGSTVFGLFRGRRAAERARRRVVRSGWTTRLTWTLGRRACERLGRPVGM